MTTTEAFEVLNAVLGRVVKTEDTETFERGKDFSAGIIELSKSHNDAKVISVGLCLAVLAFVESMDKLRKKSEDKEENYLN